MNMNVIKALEQSLSDHNIDQALISDSYHIEYLTGKHFYAGERFLGLLVRKGEPAFLYVPALTGEEELTGIEEIEIIKLKDGMDVAKLIAEQTASSQVLGIDGKLPSAILLKLQAYHAGSFYTDITEYVYEIRSVKNQDEILKMKAASKINDDAIEKVKLYIQEGVTELEVTQNLKTIYEEEGYDGQFFAIVSFGKHAANPHHRPDYTRLKPGDAVLLDIGCRKSGYWSDMTRTYYYQYVSDRCKEIYEIVKTANEAGEAAVHVGATCQEVDAAARKVITDAGYGKYFTHRLGHQIGIELHECSDINVGNTRKLKPGMIFSCEPGVYLPEEGIGVRIEDLCLVTENGAEILNKVSKELTILQ